MNSVFKVLVFIALAGMFFAAPVKAATLFWDDDTGNHDFYIGANWSGDVLPNTEDTACIQNGGTAEIGATAPPDVPPNYYIQNLYVGNQTEGTTPAGQGFLNQSGQLLSVYNDVYVTRGQGASRSVYNFTGGTLGIGYGNFYIAPGYDMVGTMNISGGSVMVGAYGGGALRLGHTFRSTGIIRQSGDSRVEVRAQLWLAEYDPLANGYYSISGGTLMVHCTGQEMEIGSTGSGLFEQSGGSVYVATRSFLGNHGTASYGVINISGGTYNNNGGGAKNVIGGDGTGVLNISGDGRYITHSDIWTGWNATGRGIVNLGTVGVGGGTLQTTGMLRNADAVGQLNFHGGTLVAGAANYNFLDSGADAVDTYIYSEGAVIDTAGNDITINNPLKAPTGDGVSSIVVKNDGWFNNFYECAPVVKISGGGGSGATGYAVLTGNKVTGVVITNPGVGYTSTPTIAMQGGKWEGHGWDTPQIDSVTLAPNVGTGGLKKIGSGTLTLTNANTYGGDTEILEGTLALGNGYPTSGSINNSPNIILAPGTAFNVYNLFATYNLGQTIPQTLSGSGTVYGSLGLLANCAIKPGTYAAGQTLNIAGPYDGTFGDLELSSASGAELEFHLTDSAAGANDKIAVTGALYQPDSGAVNVVFHGFGASLDTATNYTLVSYGSFDGSDLSRFSLVNNTRYTTSLVNVPPSGGNPGEIQLHVTGTAPMSLSWYGQSTQVWDTKSHTPWNTGDAQMFYEMDAVTFDNTSAYTGFQLVTISGEVYPSSITVNNDANHEYFFYGDGKITGTTGISKSGPGTLTIANFGGNDFSGVVSITDGTLVMGDPAALGSTAGGTTVSGTGTLDLSGQTVPQGELITISGAGFGGNGAVVNSNYGVPGVVRNLALGGNATIGGTGDWTVTGSAGTAIANDGGYTLTKTGANTVTLDNIGDSHLADIEIQQGTLLFSGNTTMGNSTVTLSNGGKLAFADSTVTPTKDLVVAASGGKIGSVSGSNTFAGNATLNGTLTVENGSGDELTLAGNLSGPGGLLIRPAEVVNNATYITGSNSYLGGTEAGISGGSSWPCDVYLNSSTGWAIPGNLTLNGGRTWVALLQGEENGGQAQMNPAGVVTFADGNIEQFLALWGHTLRVAGIVSDTVNEDANFVTNYYSGSTGTLILDTPNGATYSYRGHLDDYAWTNTGGILTLVKTGPGTQILLGYSAGNFTGGTTVDDGTLDVTGVANFTPDGPITVQGTGTMLAGALDVPSITVLDSGELTAASITTGTLSIGGSRAVGSAPVPEPGTLVLLALAGLALVPAAWRRMFRR